MSSEETKEKESILYTLQSSEALEKNNVLLRERLTEIEDGQIVSQIVKRFESSLTRMEENQRNQIVTQIMENKLKPWRIKMPLTFI